MREEVAALPASFPATKKAVGISKICCGPATGLFREVLTALYKNINPSPSPVFHRALSGVSWGARHDIQ